MLDKLKALIKAKQKQFEEDTYEDNFIKLNNYLKNGSVHNFNDYLPGLASGYGLLVFPKKIIFNVWFEK